MLNVYIIHASSRLACRDIQRIQRIQRIQLYSYTTLPEVILVGIRYTITVNTSEPGSPAK